MERQSQQPFQRKNMAIRIIRDDSGFGFFLQMNASLNYVLTDSSILHLTSSLSDVIVIPATAMSISPLTRSPKTSI